MAVRLDETRTTCALEAPVGSSGGSASFNLEVAAAGNTEVVRSKRKTMRSLGSTIRSRPA